MPIVFYAQYIINNYIGNLKPIYDLCIWISNNFVHRIIYFNPNNMQKCKDQIYFIAYVYLINYFIMSVIE